MDFDPASMLFSPGVLPPAASVNPPAQAAPWSQAPDQNGFAALLGRELRNGLKPSLAGLPAALPALTASSATRAGLPPGGKPLPGLPLAPPGAPAALPAQNAAELLPDLMEGDRRSGATESSSQPDNAARALTSMQFGPALTPFVSADPGIHPLDSSQHRYPGLGGTDMESAAVPHHAGEVLFSTLSKAQGADRTSPSVRLVLDKAGVRAALAGPPDANPRQSHETPYSLPIRSAPVTTALLDARPDPLVSTPTTRTDGAASAPPSADAGARAPVESAPARTLSAATPATSGGPALETPLGKPGWDQELGQRLVWMGRDQIQSAQLRLHPAHLGPLEVRIAVHNDSAQVSFLAQNAPVREAVEAALPRLREMMAENGFSQTDVDVSTGGGKHGGENDPDPENLFAQGEQHPDVKDTSDRQRVQAVGLVDTFA